MLERDRTRLHDELRRQRRLRLAGLGDDPADARNLRRAWNECCATSAIRDELDDPASALSARPDQDDHRPDDRADARQLDRARPGLGAAFLEVADLERQARAEADRLAACPEPEPRDGRPWIALFGEPLGQQRRRALLHLAEHLLAFRVDVGTALALLEAWDQQRNRPPLGPDQVEDVVRWIARRQLAKERAA